MQLPGHPERFQIGNRSTRRQVTEARFNRKPAHDYQLADDFQLQLGCSWSAIERMSVRIDSLGHCIGSGRDRMRWLQHLTSVCRVEKGKVVL